MLAKGRQGQLPEVEPTKSGGERATDRRRSSAKAATEGQFSLTPGFPRRMFALCSFWGNGRDPSGIGISVAVAGRVAALGKDGDTEKMYTFVSGKKTINSRHYAEFMYTFVYLVEKGDRGKSRA